MKPRFTLLALCATLVMSSCAKEESVYKQETEVETEVDNSIKKSDIIGVWEYWSGDGFISLYEDGSYILYFQSDYIDMIDEDIISSGTYILGEDKITLNSYWGVQYDFNVGFTRDNDSIILSGGVIDSNEHLYFIKSKEVLPDAPESKIGVSGSTYLHVSTTVRYKLFINIFSNYALTYTLYQKDKSGEYTILRSTSTKYYIHRDGYAYIQSISGGEVSKLELKFYVGLGN